MEKVAEDKGRWGGRVVVWIKMFFVERCAGRCGSLCALVLDRRIGRLVGVGIVAWKYM